MKLALTSCHLACSAQRDVRPPFRTGTERSHAMQCHAISRKGARCQPVLGELLFQACSFRHKQPGSMGDVPFKEQPCGDCSTLRTLTHPFLSLWVYFSPMFLEEETRTRSRILWEEPGALRFSLGASGSNLGLQMP